MPYDEDELECAHALYSYVCCAFCRVAAVASHGGSDGPAPSPTPGVPVVPAMLARGFCECARRLGRRPMLDYCGCVLYNWELVDASGPSRRRTRMLRRFTGLVDEEWFFKTHLVIEAAAGPAVRAVAAPRGAGAVTRSSVARLTEALVRVEACFGHVVRDCLPLMFERLGTHGALCDYYFFYERLRPFISASTPPSSTASPRRRHAHGDPADDASEGAKRELVALQPCVDLVLDFRWRHLQMVKKYVLEPSGNHNAAGTGGTSAFEYLHEHIHDTEAAKATRAARRTMPGPHRDFLDALDAKTSARSFVLGLTSEDRRAPVHTLAVVEAEYNGCLDELGRYCSRRSQLLDEAAALDAAVEKAAAVQKGRSRADSCASDESSVVTASPRAEYRGLPK
ncbi:indoleamine 2,3-dioxygenase [Aureococcus anophagefferens]|nr:indoleamine 2,3-dioxygenase [Aureococcus anophagefferens]